MSKRLLFTFVLVLLVGAAAPAGAEPQGHAQGETGVGFFYGTFDQEPNVVLLAGGTAEEFCEAFPGDPGTAPVRIFERNDGTTDLKVNDKNQPIYLYHTDLNDAPIWLGAVCAGDVEPDLFASGSADLKVRISVISENLVDVFNSVNGKATGTDGTEYKVRASADLIVENGMPLGDPRDFVNFEMTEIKR